MSSQQALERLIRARDAYFAAKGREDAAWVQAFNDLMAALRDARSLV